MPHASQEGTLCNGINGDIFPFPSLLCNNASMSEQPFSFNLPSQIECLFSFISCSCCTALAIVTTVIIDTALTKEKIKMESRGP